MATLSNRTVLETLVPLVGYHLDPEAVQRSKAESIWQSNCRAAGFNLSDFPTAYNHSRVVGILSALKLLKLSGSLGFLVPVYREFQRRLETTGSIYAAERLSSVLEVLELYHTNSTGKGAATGVSVGHLADHLISDDVLATCLGAVVLSSFPVFDGLIDDYFRSLTLNSLVLWREHSLTYKSEFTMRSFGRYHYVNVRSLIASNYDVNGYAHGWYSTHEEALRHAFDLLHLEDFGYQASAVPIGNFLSSLTLLDPTLLIGLSRFQAWPSFSDLHNAREVYSLPVNSDDAEDQFYWLCHAVRGLKCSQMMHNCYISGNWGMNSWPVLDSRVLSSNVLAAPFLPLVDVGLGFRFSDPTLAKAKEDLCSFTASTVNSRRSASIARNVDATLVLLTGIYRQPFAAQADFRLIGCLWNLFVSQQLAVQNLPANSELVGLLIRGVAGDYSPDGAYPTPQPKFVSAASAHSAGLTPQDWNESLLDSKL